MLSKCELWVLNSKKKKKCFSLWNDVPEVQLLISSVFVFLFVFVCFLYFFLFLFDAGFLT